MGIAEYVIAEERHVFLQLPVSVQTTPRIVKIHLLRVIQATIFSGSQVVQDRCRFVGWIGLNELSIS